MITFIVFIVIMILIFKKIGTDSDSTKKIMAVFGIFCAFPIVVGLLVFAASFFETNSNENKVADGFTIEGYEVILDVGIDNKVEVTENIDINFYEEGHHGIYKFTPYWLEYTGKDNKTIKRKSLISNLYSEGAKYTVDTVNKKERIKIGDAYRTVYGDRQYVIRYTYNMGKDPFNGFDEFIFHAFGDYWGTEIKNPKIVVHMPKDINNYEINIFKDKYRKENVNRLVNIDVDGNTIIITANDLRLSKSLTFDISLPEGYFEGGSWNYGWISTIISIAIILLTLYIIRLWFKYGKDYEKRVPTVEFYAPEGLSSAEIGYIYNNRHVSKKLTISLIIQLASKGYIKIDEIKDGKKKSKIQITKLHIKPTEPKLDSIAVPKRIIEIEKLKDADSLLSKSATSKLNYFFKDGNKRVLEANIDNFLEVKDELVSGGYINIVSDSVPEDGKKYAENKKNEIYEKALAKYNEETSKLPRKSALENIVYGNLFSIGDVVILSDHDSFYKTFGQVEGELRKNFQNKIHDDKSRSRKVEAFIIAIISIILSIVSFFAIEDMDPAWSILYFLAFGGALISTFFAFIMGRKTEYGEMISARVKGFRDFLLTAEKEKLEALVEQNPHYFYDILPYTYVLNISKKWVSKFENIKMPEPDMGNFNYSSDVSFHSIFDNVTYPVATSSGSSGGCSSCGGGCSSCGGGCSSCGGGGSW